MDSKHTFVVLPFTSVLLADPSPILPILTRAAQLSVESCTIIFSTPSASSPSQLYADIRKSPRRYWPTFQIFLGRVYAALAAGQWSVGRVLMDVEVRFHGERGNWTGKLPHANAEGDKRLVLLEGHETLPCLIDVRGALGEFATYVHPSPSPIDSSGKAASGRGSGSIDDGADQSPFPVVALGGTFDHLHAAHKLLLHLALLLAGRKLIVGLMADHLLSGKKNAELVEPFAQRVQRVQAFLRRCDSIPNTQDPSEEAGELELNVVEIQDPYGPTAWDPDIQCLVVSKETLSGGHAVNAKRKTQGLGELEVFVIDVIASDTGTEGQEAIKHESDEGKLKEMKMGSTAIRQWIRDHPHPQQG